ncbi:type 1 glutamine amidotransferase domain-containing protein [Verrucomicrobiaceae bacterium 5K15]|uniref:Type 1 glutamine amidotransferase domain-containing protein n=1 Tax=Oceaniferula flava TaxID=2800421 RepID=A0AAE2SFE2_9BACT|nr:type 1 glutamine amidotransferase domain-containing protein [Oceaniferula flavus]MBK1855336.1 type 1 glutamine amidotransferase domain-containing protein [Oceaniferula flavus]MBM1136642.1 type 1 glutamine amidotransferase domain-containing protein [Oceaniferula flavus]
MKSLLTLIASLLLIPLTQAAADKPTVLIVVTNHAKMPDGKATGLWLAEATHPWQKFVQAGYAVDFASPKGGKSPIDPRSTKAPDAVNEQFLNDKTYQNALDQTKVLKDVDAKNYAAIFFAGGHGTMWDFPAAPGASEIAGKIYAQGGIVSAVCHGPAALVNLKLPDGSLLIKGKKVTGFTNSEEDKVGLTEAVPFLLEDKLKAQGASYSSGPDFKAHTVVSDRLVTGQNPASAAPAAEAIIKLLKKRG